MTHGKEIPMFMTSRKYLAVSVLFVIAFSVFFMVIYTPFSVSSWFSIKDMGSFGISVVFTVAAIAILAVSKTAIYLLRNRICFTAARYIAWLMCENIVISLGYTILTFQLLPGITSSSIPSIAVRVLFFVTMITAIPYSLVTLYVAYRTKSEELEAALDERDRLRGELRAGRAASETATAAAPQLPQMINLYDNNGTLRLTITVDSLYYLESQDNYVKVHYKHNDKFSVYMLRSRTSSIEESLAGTGMIRCHRSYIINVRKIAFIGEEHKSYYVTLNDEQIKRIPVSKRYYDNVMGAIAALNNI
ncbi:MAG: LytTR family DNA-binding domain-containing protein [Alistipes sp.]|nr:LytTR family DNA-binding domain-containing protein [Alistipes sp.]